MRQDKDIKYQSFFLRYFLLTIIFIALTYTAYSYITLTGPFSSEIKSIQQTLNGFMTVMRNKDLYKRRRIHR
jgi:hypothetical protein